MGRLAVICALLKHATLIVFYADDVSRFRLLLECVAFKCRANAFPWTTFESSQLSLDGRAVVVPSSLDFGRFDISCETLPGTARENKE